MKCQCDSRWWTTAAVLIGATALSYLSTKPHVEGASLMELFTFTKTRGETMSATRSSAQLEHVHKGDFAAKVLRSQTPVLVDFYADWCGPCRALAPVLEELARETPNAKIVKVNVDQEPELAAQYGIDSIPSLLVFRDSRLTSQHNGLADKASLKRLLAK